MSFSFFVCKFVRKNIMNLFLDDIRMPIDASGYTKESMFETESWEIVRNFQEFVDFINKNGLPDFISFDHDLADEHYTPEEYWHDYEVSKAYQESQNYKEKTGYDCAKWLIEYCMDNNKSLPGFYCHSMNPVGKDNIISILEQFSKQQ